MLIRRAVLLDRRRTDIRVGEQIEEVAAGLTPRRGEVVYDAAHGLVLPGLHDHHLHLRAAAAALHSVRVGPDEIASRQDLANVLATAAVGSDGWLRAVGYHDAAAGPLDRDALDELAPPIPVRVQHRSGAQWILNSVGLSRVGLADHPDGRLRSTDGSWSSSLLRSEPSLAEIGARLSRHGVTGVTDATPDLEDRDVEGLQDAHRRGELRQRVHFLAPGKRILHDDDLDLEGLIRWISDRHAAGGPVAVHCVTAAQLVVTLEALRCAGRHPGDRIEHAAVVPDGSLSDLAASGATVVTQPNFVAERGDQYLRDIPVAEHHELWRVGALRRAGIPVALSTDAPFGDVDPWAAMRAAVHRRTVSGAVFGESECITVPEALAMFLGEAARPASPRAVAPGAPGDLCVVSTSPAETMRELDCGMVAATVIAGELVFERP